MTTQTTASAGARRAKRRRPNPLTIVGIILLCLGLTGGGYVLWELYGDPLMDPTVAATKVDDLKKQWASGDATSAGSTATSTVPGDAIALLRIPDFGASFEVPVVNGVDDASLAKGVGWFTDTTKPGQIGNFAVAGHRGSRGPFVPLPGLAVGAKVIVETRDAIYTYVLDNHPADLTVDSSATWVLDPVPGKPANTTPTQALITLVTCAELFHSPLRTVAFGHLESTQNK